MTIKHIPEILKEHPFKDLHEDYIQLLAGCGTNQTIKPGKIILEEGKPADHCYLIRQGTVAVEVHVPIVVRFSSKHFTRETSWGGPGFFRPTSGPWMPQR